VLIPKLYALTPTPLPILGEGKSNTGKVEAIRNN
jgi:hypothetical protein